MLKFTTTNEARAIARKFGVRYVDCTNSFNRSEPFNQGNVRVVGYPGEWGGQRKAVDGTYERQTFGSDLEAALKWLTEWSEKDAEMVTKYFSD